MISETLFQNVGTKNRLVDRVADEIQRLITSGQLIPGTRLPPEREFAEQLGVSRPVVREAVHQLVAKGLLESKHGSGTTVRQVTREALVEPLGWIAQAHGATLDDLHDVRSILEIAIAKLAAAQASDVEIARLREIVGQMEGCKDDVACFVGYDADFHQALSETTHNPLLAVLLDSVRDLMQQVRLQVHRHPAVYETVVPDHEAIVAAVAARDPEAAARAMQRHLDHARTFQRAILASQAAPAADRILEVSWPA
jgi:GntR family transcriptional regulator, transcriptional repressor for pyruvate dehydrogenase complex